MRITFVLDTFGGGGKERRCLQLIQGLNNKGFNDIQVIIINNKVDYPDLYKTAAKITILNRKELNMSSFKVVCELYDLLKKFDPEIVQVWGLMSAFYINIIKLFMRFHYLASYVADCNTPKKINKLINIITYKLCDSVIGNSKAGIIAYRIPISKACVIYNGFNIKRLNFLIDKNKKKTDLKIITKHVVTMVARVDHNKDYRTFINSAKSILKKRNDITFLAVGDGELFDYYSNQLRDNEKQAIRFLGFRNDIEEILFITDVSILCTNSEKHGEGISNSILESLAIGVPVVATNGGGTPEIIEDSFNGYLVECFDEKKLSEKIELILNDSKKKSELSKNAKLSIREKFVLDKVVDSYVSLYFNILK